MLIQNRFEARACVMSFDWMVALASPRSVNMASTVVIVAMLCAGSASAVIVEAPGGKRLSYEPLAGATQTAPAGAVPQAVPDVRLGSPAPECYPDGADSNCTEDPREPLITGGA